MELNTPKLMAFDLDGTLAESKQRVTAEMGEALSELTKKMPVAVMSGAGWAQFETQFFPAMPLDANLDNLYIFPTNAAQCYVHRSGAWKPQYDHSFSDAERAAIDQALAEALPMVGLAEDPAQVWGPRIEYRSGGQVSFSPLGQQAPVPAKQEWNRQYNDVRKKLRDLLAERLPECSVSMGGLTTIDITHTGIDKAYGLTRLAELTGIPIAQMLYVGDALDEGGNDAVVIKTGVRTRQVFSPEESLELIRTVAENAVSIGA